MGHRKLLKWFLLGYIGLLLLHALQMEITTSSILALTTGATVAYLAHRRHGHLPLVFLVIHMGIEWSEYAKHWFHFTPEQYALYSVHTAMDFGLLYIEVKEHFGKWKRLVITMTAIVLGSVFWLSFEKKPTTVKMMLAHSHHHHHGHHHGQWPLEPLLLGGVIVCAVSHIPRRQLRRPASA